MTGGQPPREHGRRDGAPREHRPDQREITGQTAVTSDPGAAEEGGEAACWAHLVCPDCGAVQGEDHRSDCVAGTAAPAAR